MDSEELNENHFHEGEDETNQEQDNNCVDEEQEQDRQEGDEEHIEEEHNEEERENQKEEEEQEHDESSPAAHDPEIESSVAPSNHFDDKDPLNHTASPAAIPRPPSTDLQQLQKNSIKNSSTTTTTIAENSDYKFGQDVLSFDSNHTSKEQMEKQKSLFPPPSSSFPCHIFDPPPSSMHLLKLKPLGLFHKEPHTMKELIEPIPPDRSTFKGGLFNRKIHASNRKRTYDKHNFTTIADRISPTRTSRNASNNNNQNNNTARETSAAATGSNMSHFPPPQQQQQQPPPPQQLMTDFITISKIAVGNPSSNAGSRSPRRRLSTASSTVGANDKSYLDMRQHITPTKLLPYKGQLPDASELYLADLRAAAKESAQATEEVVVHGREVVARKANTSPVGIYTEMLRKTSPVTGKLAIHHQQMMAKMQQQQQKIFKEQQAAQSQQPQVGRRNKNASSKDATPSSTNLLVVPDECEQSLMMENSFLKSMIMLDPELAPGLVAHRATLPPWAKAQQAEMSREELELLQMKNRKMLGAGGGGKKSGSPRFAAPTASRIKQLPVLQQAQINRQLISGQEKPQQELEKQHMMFPSQLRPEDRVEIERREKALKDQSRRHYLDHMVLARLAPAEREARLADREKLAPYRKVTDRDLPFPEQAARDRLKHAKAKVPALVLEGQLAVETMIAYWKPKTTSPTNQLGSAASFSASLNNNNNNNNNSGNLNSSLNIVTSPLLISSLGLSSTSIPQTARVGAGGDLPSEGAPKPKQPLTGRDKQIEKATERVQEQEKDLAQKYANLEAKLQAKQSRSQKKVFSS